MALIQLWTEGYVAQGNRIDATFHGEFEASTLREAAEMFKNSLTDQYSRDCIDLESMTNWGRRFFDNGEDARKSFG